MQVNKIKTYIAEYKKWLQRKTLATERNLFKWETQLIWQKNFDLEADNFAEMYAQSLENTTTRRLWNSRNYEPKRMMLTFANMQPFFVQSMFQELFDESKDIENRVDRFLFYCDELLVEYKNNHPTSIENNHFHDYPIIAYYLSFQFSNQYTPYRFDHFQKTLQLVGSKDIPKTNDISRHFKVMRVLGQFLRKDKDVLDLHQKRLSEQHYDRPSLLLVDDFVYFICEVL